MELGIVLLITCIVAGGIAGALLRTWSIHSRLYSLSDRLNIVEGILQREVKTRAATERWKRPSRDEEAVSAALLNPPPAQHVPWWNNPALKKGAYVP
jgi:hypothetical protein